MLHDNITALKGIGAAKAKLFEKVGVVTVQDLLYYFPRGYEDRTKTVPIYEAYDSQTVCIKATVFSAVRQRRISKTLSLYSVELADESGQMQATWFNNKYIKNSIHKGETYIFYGKVRRIGPRKTMENPIFERLDKPQVVTGKIVPLYPLTEGLTQKIVQTAMTQALDAAAELSDPLPRSLLARYSLVPLRQAVENIHFPSDFEAFEQARRRLVFEELLTLSLSLAKIKQGKTAQRRETVLNTSCIEEFTSSLPYRLTRAQQTVLGEICTDLSSHTPMNRLVQGDVGSGKTVVAAAAMYVAAKNGCQAALMAPTEILARQHYENFVRMMNGRARVCLLIGSMRQKEKEAVYEEIESGSADIIIGTHAMIQERVVYKNLALVVTDEQHRFGVIHRDAIAQKGDNPHVMVMSATPIPRTLALILYGDLDISIIDELPPGRKPVATYAVGESMRKRIYAFLKKHIDNGRQAYIVCPLIEETENADLKNVAAYAKTLAEKVFPTYRIALLHSRLPVVEKEALMTQFKKGNIDILVSTTVIEVGVDVANANIMVIENAERFGLSQLHQLRGRVGRGSEQSYCILFNQSDGELAKKRMQILCESNDGFVISEEDLKLRGPGDFFGTKQHGLPTLRIANLFSDMDILKEAQQAASLLQSGALNVSAEEQAALGQLI
ncbi:MAG TPA: ATP-dependent DNA helicase RecG, partial [Candidatus Aphodoplasma excrementigallinarum]|nr:ATP-dependent DNA helicase RecG [Candidatus Aphodoplasma excrementigallinarum]